MHRFHRPIEDPVCRTTLDICCSRWSELIGTDPRLAVAARISNLSQKRLQRAVSLFRLSADQGNAAALNNLAICMETGAGVERDEVAAERLYERAADLGNSNAAANAGRLLMQRKLYKRARHYLQRAILYVDDGPSAAAFVLLGELYMIGLAGLGTCYVTAYELFKQAATLGHAKGQFYIGQMLFSGVGVERNVERAFQMYKASALQGYAQAQNAFAIMLEEGHT